MTETSENNLPCAVRDAINAAEEIADYTEEAARAQKPRLLVQDTDPDLSVAALRDILAEDGELFDRGVPVRLIRDPMYGGHQAHAVTPKRLGHESALLGPPVQEKGHPGRGCRGRRAAADKLSGHVSRLAR